MLASIAVLLTSIVSASAVPVRRADQCAIPATVGPQPMARSDQTTSTTANWAIRFNQDSDFLVQAEGQTRSSFVRLRSHSPTMQRFGSIAFRYSSRLVPLSSASTVALISVTRSRVRPVCHQNAILALILVDVPQAVLLSAGKKFPLDLKKRTIIITTATCTARDPRKAGRAMKPDLEAKRQSRMREVARGNKVRCNPTIEKL